MIQEGRDYLLTHRAHDTGYLLRRWRQVLRGSGWRSTELMRVGPWPILVCRTRAENEPALYLSSGLHGDEPAAPWGLVEWFGKRARALAGRSILIFPCLNPVGLMLNTRTDGEGQDLNRMFHSSGHPLIDAWRRAVGERRFRLTVCLHEDYDAQGCYAYELARPGSDKLADRLLKRIRNVIPPDPRRRIDGRRSIGGVIRRSTVPIDLVGHPEALALNDGRSDHNITFETPSEFSFADRVRAHGAFLDAVVEQVFGVGASGE